jgi:GntR family histidine utilization transcriptional repressor
MAGLAANTWQDVHDEVLRRIHDRVWLPGDPIPNEQQLAEEFGCARTTVNRALRELAASGRLERRRRAGTRVARNPARRATFDIPVTRIEIESRGARYGYRLVSASEADAPAGMAGRLDLAAGTRMLHVKALHLADGRPHAFEDRWINLAAVPAIREVDLARVSANEWLVNNAALTRGDVTFSAEAAAAEPAAILDVAPGAPLFVVERTTWTHAAPITVVKLHHAPGYRMHTVI